MLPLFKYFSSDIISLLLYLLDDLGLRDLETLINHNLIVKLEGPHNVLLLGLDFLQRMAHQFRTVAEVEFEGRTGTLRGLLLSNKGVH